MSKAAETRKTSSTAVDVIRGYDSLKQCEFMIPAEKHGQWTRAVDLDARALETSIVLEYLSTGSSSAYGRIHWRLIELTRRQLLMCMNNAG